MTWNAPIEFPAGLDALEPPEDFLTGASAIGVRFEPGELERLGRYLALLLAANTKINLTAVRDPADAWMRHLLDSLTLLPVLDDAHPDAPPDADTPRRVIDVGSGGGLPGMPLAICRPDYAFTLLDSTAKKCAFLQHCVRELELSNVNVVCARAEQVGHDRGEKIDRGGESFLAGAMRESFDFVTARAVGRLATLLELTVPLARVGGLCALTKGQKADEELREAKGAMHLLHAAHAGTIDTPTGRIVVFEKLRKTPRLYPRPAGEPKRKPLGTSGHK